MASPKPQELFQKAFDEFLNELPDKRRSQFRNTTLDDLHLEIAKLQHEEARKRSRSRLPTIQPFLEAFNRYAVVMDVFAQSTLFMPLIWGPVRFLLQISSSFLPAREKLLKALQRIGKDLPFIDKNASYLTKPRFESIVVDIYVDTLSLLRLAVRIIGSSRLEKLAGALWPPFDSQLDDILEKFGQDTKYLEKALREEQFDTILEIRAKASDTLKLQNLQLIHTALQEPSMFYQQLQKGKDIRAQFPASGNWLFDTDKYKQWLQMDSTSTILRLSGMPGAGKTMLCSVIASEIIIKKGNDAAVVSIFCSYDDAKSSTCLGVLASIVVQLIHRVPYSHEAIVQRFGANFSRIYTMENLLECIELILISARPLTYLILDGVDEMQQSERKLLLDYIQKLSKEESDETYRFRVLVSSRAEADIGSLLANVPEITITAESNASDIKRYLLRGETITELQNAIDVEREIVEEFLMALIFKVDGMFLYARVVLEILKTQTSNLKQMRQVVDSNPDAIEGLKVAYHRILERIDQQHRNVRKPARRILKLLLATTEPLRVQEIMYAVALDHDTLSVDDENRLRRTLEFYCGPIIEVNNDYVRLVHKTAGDYLLQHSERLLDLSLDGAERLCARLTARYLSCTQFDTQEISNPEKLRTMILRGDYVWMNYAFQNWFRHALKSRCRKQAVETLCNKIFLANSDNTTDPLQQYQAFCNDGTFCTDIDPSELRSIIIKVIERIRSLEDDTSFEKTFTKYYGSGIYKCNRPNCRMFLEGFPKRKNRDDHEQLHSKILKCEIEGCDHLITSSKMLKQHMLLFHKIDQDATNDRPKRKASSILNKISQTKSPNDRRILMDAIESNDLESTLLALKSFLGPVRRIKPPTEAKPDSSETWPKILAEALTRAAILGRDDIIGAISIAGSFNHVGGCPLEENTLHLIVQKDLLGILDVVWRDEESWFITFEDTHGEMETLTPRNFFLYLGFRNSDIEVISKLGGFGLEAVEAMLSQVAGLNDKDTTTKILEFIRRLAPDTFRLDIACMKALLEPRSSLRTIIKERWFMEEDPLQIFLLRQLGSTYMLINFYHTCERVIENILGLHDTDAFAISPDDFFKLLEVANLEYKLKNEVPMDNPPGYRENLEKSASAFENPQGQLLLENLMITEPPKAIFSMLLDYYSGVRGDGPVRFHPLFIAPDVEMIKKILEMGASVNVFGGAFKKNAFSHQALDISSETVANLCFLARNGADIHAVDEYGDNALVNSLVKCRDETNEIASMSAGMQTGNRLHSNVYEEMKRLEDAVSQLNERLYVIQLLVGLRLDYGELMRGRMAPSIILKGLHTARKISVTSWETVMEEWKSVPAERYLEIKDREELISLPINSFKQNFMPSLSILRFDSSLDASQ